MDIGRGERNSSVQSNFRKALIEAYGSSNPNPGWEDTIWCPVLHRWVSKQNSSAGHIFSYRHGQNVMHAIFGAMDEPELFSARNGLMVSRTVKDKLDRGFFSGGTRCRRSILF